MVSQRHRRARGAGKGLSLVIAAAACCGLATFAYVAFTLWPRWPDLPVAPDAPSLPITVAGVAFNVPPAAIRIPVQRRPGAQPRLDLAFVWPGLAPPNPAAKPALAEDPRLTEQLFVSIAGADDALSFADRIKAIYPRYVEPDAFRGPEGLIGVAFRAGTPYQGEDLFFAAGRPESFIVRCTRQAATRGSCLYERRIGGVDVTVRFPRDWLKDWEQLGDGMNQLIEMLRAGTS